MAPTEIAAIRDHYTFKGYSITREFFSPEYNNQNLDRSIPDIRTTLYWNPSINLDNNGVAHFHFFNSDKAKKFRVVIEGMDEQGRVAHFASIID